jgi:hypothetical protein
MCTSIVEIVPADGMAKGGEAWFPVTDAVVAYDHARHALLDDAITLDFVNRGLPPGARAAVELTLESAKALRDALARAIAAAEIEESERPAKDAGRLLPVRPVREPAPVHGSAAPVRSLEGAGVSFGPG